MERHKNFRQEEVAISKMPILDIPMPSGVTHAARVGRQLNHPTERCTKRPGQTLDKKSPTTRRRCMMDKGVHYIRSFTFDTINRRTPIRRVQVGNKLVRTYKTEPKTWTMKQDRADRLSLITLCLSEGHRLTRLRTTLSDWVLYQALWLLI